VALSLSGTVLASAHIVVDLALTEPVQEAWKRESSCTGMSVGGLAHHLTSQVDSLVRLLPDAPDQTEPISILEHYRRAAWANTGLACQANIEIREVAEGKAEPGPAELATHTSEQLARLPSALAAVDDADPVLIPWQGWALTAHDFAVTRLMEMVVHADDLAASVAVDTPEFPADAVRLVLDLLTGVAVDRHGQAAVVRALSRPQRAPRSVSAF